MRNFYYIFTACLLSFSTTVFSATIDWQYTMSTPMRMDSANATSRGPNDTVFLGGDAHFMFMGDNDYFVTKLDYAGNVIWQRTYGGDQADALKALAALPDGGVLAGGNSRSGISGDKSQPAVGSDDYWLLRLDSAGNVIWEITLGGTDHEDFQDIVLTRDGNIIISGSSMSQISGDKTDFNRNQGLGVTRDFWVLKLDLNGVVLWQKTLGGAGHDNVGGLAAGQHGGVIVAGSSASNISFEKTQNSKGAHDYWVVKLDTNGNVVWDKTFGGSDVDILYSVTELRNGNIILGGSSRSSMTGDKTDAAFNNDGTSDYWVLALNNSGHPLWDKTYGSEKVDALFGVTETLDDGVLITGYSDSDLLASGNKASPGKGLSDYWIIKLNALGQEQWQQVLGGSRNDWLTSASVVLSDGSYILTGTSNSPADGDKSIPSDNVAADAWTIKLTEPLTGVSAFHFEDPFGRSNTVFNCVGWDIYLNGAASQNENNYYIDAWRRPVGTTQAFSWQASIGWWQGFVGRVNLTDLFAGILPPAGPYVFAPGYEYQIKLAVQNLPQFAWVETVHTFIVPAQLNANCRHPIALGPLTMP